MLKYFQVTLLLGYLFTMADPLFSQTSEKFAIEIAPGSQLTIYGKSNVNEFACILKKPVQTLELSHHQSLKNKDYILENAKLTLPVKSCDCGHKRMNHDMYQALKADKYPSIQIEILRLEPPQSWQKWPVLVNAIASITIAGVTKVVHLPTSLRQIPPLGWHASSRIDLKMTDFGIQPPTALMGVIKTANDIKIVLDLNLRPKSN